MPSSGSRFGRYEIRERLGAGGMGEVYRARDTELPRDVAIKLLSDPFVTDPARLARFATEARAASALNHPNILTVHDVGESDGQPFIVMECVEGKTLRELMGPTPMPPKAVLDIGAQIADGLAKAHAIGIVHRDLKPENVMVTEDGLVKIVDFGLAKPPVFDVGAEGSDVETRPGSPTVHGSILGTPGYMAPEQARGEAVDHRTDQFALGAILYEMATGRRAFNCPSSIETLAATLDREPEPVAALNPTIPAQARWLIERCLAKKPKQRYASTEDLARELRTIREHIGEPWPTPAPMPPTPAPVTPAPRPRFAIPRRTMLVAALILVAAFLASPLRTPLWRMVAGPPWPEKHLLAVLPITSQGDVGEVANGLLGFLVTRLKALNAFDRGFSVVSAAEIVGDGVTTPRAARAKFGATIALSVSVARLGDDIEVSFEIADTANASVLDTGSLTLTGTSRSREVVVNQVIKALKIHLQPGQQVMWAKGLTTNLQAETLFAQGLTPFQQGSVVIRNDDQESALNEAIRFFNLAVDNDPGYGAAWAALGEAYLRLFRLKEDTRLLEPAEAALAKALGIDKTRPSVWITLGMLHVAKGDMAEAERAFQRVIAINPAGADAYRELGYAYLDANLLEKADAQFRKALDLEPSWTNHSHMGVLRYRQERFAEAESEFKAGLALAPENAKLWSNLASVYLRVGETKDKAAEDALSRAIEINPRYANAVSNLGYLQFRQRRDAEAARTFARAADLSPADADLWRNLGSAQFFATGDRASSLPAYQKAAGLYEQRRTVNPTDPHTMVHLAACYAVLGRTPEARTLVGEAVKRGLKDQDLAVAASVYDELGDRASALGVVRGALAAGQQPGVFEQARSLEKLRADPRYADILRTTPQTRKDPSTR
jgi:Flp pilus assembly protein TadD